MSVVLVVGSYARAGDAGIHTFAFDPAGATTTAIGAWAPGMQASFLCRSADGRFLYAVDERTRAASVSAFAIGEDGRISLVNTQPAFGALPCYIASRGRWVVAASHGSDGTGDSTLALYPLAADGALEAACDVHVFDGRRPHAHSATFDPAGRFLIVCDKGADRIHTFAIDREALVSRHVLTVTPGSGPHHPAFHPDEPLVLVSNENDSTLSAYAYDPATGALTPLTSVRTVPEPGAGNAPADVQVHPSGRFAYVLNRGRDEIAGFALDPATGGLTAGTRLALTPAPQLGLGARSLAFDPSGRLLFVTDRPANALLALAVDPSTGALTQVGRTPVPEPAFVLVCPGRAILSD